MRQPRFLAPWKDDPEGKAAVYHCISRVVDRQYVLKRPEKEQFVKYMRLYERFCGVRIRSYSVMCNHFHLMVEVPSRPEEPMSDEELFRRLGMIYSELHVEEVRHQIAIRREAGDDEGAEQFKAEKYLYRMWDLSQFMKVLKQRFTQWFNKRHGRKGTLWEDRFKSVLVEDGYTARVMSAYIDLNPLRAGMVADPARYRWSSYGAAVAGDRLAREGIERTMRENEEEGTGVKESMNWRKVAGMYRVILFEDGEERFAHNAKTLRTEKVRQGVSKKAVERERRRGGQLSRAELLRCKVRHFADGMVIGSRGFVDEVFEQSRERFGPNRKDGSREIRGTQEDQVWSMRDLGTVSRAE